MKSIAIDPVTRLEGHGKIQIFLDGDGNVANAYFQVPELRGFEKFCQGRPVTELPRIVPRICGVCPGAHHMASGKAVDAVYSASVPAAAVKLRELFYAAHYVHSHVAHFYALAAPDFILGPDENPAMRNILGVVAKVGIEVGKDVIKHRAYAQEIQTIVAGKATHPVWTLPGGVSKGITEEERRAISEKASSCVEFAKFSLGLFHKVVLENSGYVDMIMSDAFSLKTNYMGMVDDRERVSFYDGAIKVVDPEGKEIDRFAAKDYLLHISEHVEPWTYLKFPYLKKNGWNGLEEGKASGVYRVAPLARLNVARGMATPLAEEEYQKYVETLGGKPVHSTLATHWARLVELMYAAERAVELANDSDITSTDIRKIPTAIPSEGVGAVEAPRGTLFHHYKTDEKGIVTRVNLIVGTTNNHAAICMSVKKAAQALIKSGTEVAEGILNRIEMAFRAYDPCYSCATHSLPGGMPMTVTFYDVNGNPVKELTRHG